jgi:transposase
MPQRTCLECGKTLLRPRAKRCKTCAEQRNAQRDRAYNRERRALSKRHPLQELGVEEKCLAVERAKKAARGPRFGW